jgi:hypothetical protein
MACNYATMRRRNHAMQQYNVAVSKAAMQQCDKATMQRCCTADACRDGTWACRHCPATTAAEDGSYSRACCAADQSRRRCGRGEPSPGGGPAPCLAGWFSGRSGEKPIASPPCARSADARGATRNMGTQQESAAVQHEICGCNRNPPRCNTKYADATGIRRGATDDGCARHGRRRLAAAGLSAGTLASVCVCVCALAYVCVCARALA